MWSVLLQLKLFPQNPFHNLISLIQGMHVGVVRFKQQMEIWMRPFKATTDAVIFRIEDRLPDGKLATSMPIDEISLRLWTTNKVQIKNLTHKNKDQIKKGDALLFFSRQNAFFGIGSNGHILRPSWPDVCVFTYITGFCAQINLLYYIQMEDVMKELQKKS